MSVLALLEKKERWEGTWNKVARKSRGRECRMCSRKDVAGGEVRWRPCVSRMPTQGVWRPMFLLCFHILLRWVFQYPLQPRLPCRSSWDSMGPCATLLPQFYTNLPFLLSRPRLSSPGSPRHLGASGCFLCCFGFGLILPGVFKLQLLQGKLREIPVRFSWLLSDWIFISNLSAAGTALGLSLALHQKTLEFPTPDFLPWHRLHREVGGAGGVRWPCNQVTWRGCLISFCRLSSSLRQKASLLKVEMNPPRTFWSSVCCNI